MRILVIGETPNFEECQQKFGPNHSYFHGKNPREAKLYFEQSDLVFDFGIDRWQDQIETYYSLPAPVFLNTSKITLLDLRGKENSDRFWFGFAGLITFLNRDVLEVSLSRPSHHEKLTEICSRLRTDFEVVKDCVGLVTPRVICMIINEAYYTAEEGTATREDIDLAMKLGTNYPFGPFEWCKKIGVVDVYEVLSRVYETSKNERYKICPLLEREYLAARS